MDLKINFWKVGSQFRPEGLVTGTTLLTGLWTVTQKFSQHKIYRKT